MIAKNPSMPLLTVLMPVYNAEKFLKDSIGSILKQTYSDFELLILDDGSTDNSLKIIRAYAKEDKRIKILVNKTNQGEAKCRNRLLKNSKTEFIAWMDSDVLGYYQYCLLRIFLHYKRALKPLKEALMGFLLSFFNFKVIF